METRAVDVECDGVWLDGDLTAPPGVLGVVLFAHGSGSSRLSPRNRYVADILHAGGLGTLLFDLLTPEEGRVDRRTRHLRFDIPLLARRLVGATDWLLGQRSVAGLPLGYFGASTGAAAALIAAAERPGLVTAVVSRGGRPDLAGTALHAVRAPTLLIVGGQDSEVIALNESALAQLRGEKKLEIVGGATHLFEEPGTLEQVATLTRDWFGDHFAEYALRGASANGRPSRGRATPLQRVRARREHARLPPLPGPRARIRRSAVGGRGTAAGGIGDVTMSREPPWTFRLRRTTFLVIRTWTPRL